MNYSNPALDTSGSFTAPDNFTNSNVAVSVGGRVFRSGVNGGKSNNLGGAVPALYEVDETANPSATLDSITFAGTLNSNNGQAGTYAVFGVSGTIVAVPEPGTWAMLLGGAAGLIGMQAFRRRNA